LTNLGIYETMSEEKRGVFSHKSSGKYNNH